MWRNVCIPKELAEAIDEIVSSAKDEYGTPRWRSRAHFVIEASKELLNKTKKGAPRND